MVKQAVGTMSGGEKARLVLAMIVWQRPNLLLLDEPTNHLDLATREALAMALNEFEGTVMLVSHDRALLRAVCDEFWLVGRGVVGPFDGDLDDYQRYLLDEAKRLREFLHRRSTKRQVSALLVHHRSFPVNTTAILSAWPEDERDRKRAPARF
jgi:ATP-binding cassette subfamily F protein 3